RRHRAHHGNTGAHQPRNHHCDRTRSGKRAGGAVTAGRMTRQTAKVINKSYDLMLDITSGHPGIDLYLAQSYERVRGMSSRFAAAICGYLIRRQSALGIDGELVEIGTFEGRFFIAMALGLAPGEKALGIDRFDWPDAGVEGRFLANCAAHGITG